MGAVSRGSISSSIGGPSGYGGAPLMMMMMIMQIPTPVDWLGRYLYDHREENSTKISKL